MEHDWQQLLCVHGPAWWRFLRCFVGHEADARDGYQTVFLIGTFLAREEKQGVIFWQARTALETCELAC